MRDNNREGHWSSAQEKPKGPIIGWLSYDFAASSYSFAVVALFLPLFYTTYILKFSSPTVAWGILVFVSFLILAFAGPIFGIIADKFDLRTVVFKTTVLMTAVLIFGLAYMSASSVVLAIVWFIGLNVCFGVASFFYDSHLLESLPRRERLTTYSGIGWSLGYIGGPVSVFLIYLFLGGSFPEEEKTYRNAFKIVAIFYFLCALPALTLIRSNTNNPAVSKSKTRMLGDWLNHKPFFIFLAAVFFISEGSITVIYFISVYSKNILGLNLIETVFLLSFSQFIGVFATTIFAYFAEKFGEILVLIICCMIWILALVLLYFSNSKEGIFLVATFIGLVIGSIPAIIRGYVAKTIPVRNRAEAFSLTTTASRFAAIVGPLTFIILVSRLGEKFAMLTSVPFFIVGIGILLWINANAVSET